MLRKCQHLQNHLNSRLLIFYHIHFILFLLIKEVKYYCNVVFCTTYPCTFCRPHPRGTHCHKLSLSSQVALTFCINFKDSGREVACLPRCRDGLSGGKALGFQRVSAGGGAGRSGFQPGLVLMCVGMDAKGNPAALRCGSSCRTCWCPG